MGDTERPTLDRDGDQEAQAQQLVRTGNGPTVNDEGELLAEQYGPADMAGYHTLPAPAEDSEPADDGDVDEPADQDGTAEGGESA